MKINLSKKDSAWAAKDDYQDWQTRLQQEREAQNRIVSELWDKVVEESATRPQYPAAPPHVDIRRDITIILDKPDLTSY